MNRERVIFNNMLYFLISKAVLELTDILKSNKTIIVWYILNTDNVLDTVQNKGKFGCHRFKELFWKFLSPLVMVNALL